MSHRFPKKPPIRFRLTKAQARKIEQSKEADESVMVVGYAQRHPWPDPDKFTLCAWFIDQDATQEALKAVGIMAKRKRAAKKTSRKRTKKKTIQLTQKQQTRTQRI